MWPRYVDTFGSIQKNIESHKALVDRQLNIFVIRECVRNRERHLETTKAFQKAEEERERRLGLEYLQPFDYDKQNQSIETRFCEGTCIWIQGNRVFKKWIEPHKNAPELKERLLWLVGIPGAGL